MNPYIIQGIGKSMQNASETLLNVSLKKQELETKKKDTDLTHKIKMLEYEKLEREMDPQLYKDTISLENKKNKLANAATDIALDELGMMQSKTKKQAETLDTYAKGMSDEAQANETSQGFPLGSQRYDLDLSAAGKGEASFKSRDYSTQLKEEKAKEELVDRRNIAEIPGKEIPGKKLRSSQDWIERTKPEFGDYGKETNEIIDSINTFQDLIDIYKNSLQLEADGIKVDKIAEYYEDEFKKLKEQGLI